MNEKTSPLVFIQKFATSINALGIGLVVYKPVVDLSHTETARYEGCTLVPKMCRPENAQVVFDAMVDKLADDEEIGICSRFANYQGGEQHFTFGDMVGDTEKVPWAGRLDVLSSEAKEGRARQFHFYTAAVTSEFHRLQGELLLAPNIDVKWVAAGLFNGFNILRLTANDETRWPEAPYLLAPEMIAKVVNDG